jgi:biotin transporter BioY
MTSTLVCGYLFGWVIAAIGVAVIIGKLSDPVRPQRYPIPLTVAASAAWPLVVLGAAQMATVALVVDLARGWRRRSIRKRARAFADNELDDLLDEWLNAPGADAPTGT